MRNFESIYFLFFSSFMCFLASFLFWGVYSAPIFGVAAFFLFHFHDTFQPLMDKLLTHTGVKRVHLPQKFYLWACFIFFISVMIQEFNHSEKLTWLPNFDDYQVF